MAVAGLIVGLGNPGKQYESTRHNMGFLFVDELLREAKNVSSMSGDKFRCELWKAALPGSPDQWLIAKPQTFMNLSGECVQPLAAWHRLLPENILVVHDELDLLPGTMKIKLGGGNAGHNGLKDITEKLGTPNFWRLSFGIGHPRVFCPGMVVADWVLGRPTSEHRQAIDGCMIEALKTLDNLVAGNMDRVERVVMKFAHAPKPQTVDQKETEP